MKVQVLLMTVGLACAGFGAGYPSDLVLYSTLDSAADVTAPRVGAPGEVKDADFIDGLYGKAIRVLGSSVTPRFMLESGLPVEKGSIEFYAKIVTDHTVYVAGNDVYFLASITDAGALTDRFLIDANDGGGGHGFVCSYPVGMGRTSYEGYGSSYDFSTIYGQKDPKEWHHYAIVWNTNGIAGSSHAMRLYLDEEIVLSNFVSSVECDDAYVSRMVQKVWLHLGGGLTETVYDELRIWSTDRTTFPEGPINPDVVPPVVSEVTAKQHYPWCGKVDIGYTVAGSTDGLKVKITVKDNTNDKTYEAKTFDVAPTAAAGTHTVVWDATADGVTTASQNMVATVSLIVPEN